MYFPDRESFEYSKMLKTGNIDPSQVIIGLEYWIRKLIRKNEKKSTDRL